jgi:hypothetical protein
LLVDSYLPHIGAVTIWMNEYPMLKFGMIGILALIVIADRSQSA